MAKETEPRCTELGYFLMFNQLDVRVLVGDDELLEGGILAALEEYNTEELATVEVPGIDGKVGPFFELFSRQTGLPNGESKQRHFGLTGAFNLPPT